MSQQINLFNPIFLKKKKYFSAITMAQALGLILFGSLLLGAYLDMQVASLKDEGAATARQLKSTQARLVEIAALYSPRRPDPAVENAIKNAETNLQSMLAASAALQKGEFGNAKGFSAYFTALSRQSISGVWLTGVSVEGAGHEIGIRGHTLQAELVPAYLRRLRSEPVMQGKSFATLEMRVPEHPVAWESQGKAPHPAIEYLEFSLHSAGVKEMPAGGVRQQ